jgi:hypothetical protein
LLGGIERLVGIQHPDLIPAVPKILMALYQSDLLEEEVVTQWGTHVSKKYVDKDTSKKVRKASEPFLKVRLSFYQQESFSSFYLSGLRRQTTRKTRYLEAIFEAGLHLNMICFYCVFRKVASYFLRIILR